MATMNDSIDHTVCVYDVAGGKHALVASWPGPKAAAGALAFSPLGTFVVTYCRPVDKGDKELQVREARTGKLVAAWHERSCAGRSRAVLGQTGADTARWFRARSLLCGVPVSFSWLLWRVSGCVPYNGGSVSLSLTHSLTLANTQYSARRFPYVRWTDDEAHALRTVSGKMVHFFAGADVGGPVTARLHWEGVADATWAPIWRGAGPGDGTPAPPAYRVAATVEEVAGKAARVALWELAEVGRGADGASAARSFFQASEVDVFWNCRGTAVLVRSHSDVDVSGASYYGVSGLYLIRADGTLDEPVELQHADGDPQQGGPLHDFAWNPATGKEFIVCSGVMPCVHPSLSLSLSLCLTPPRQASRGAVQLAEQAQVRLCRGRPEHNHVGAARPVPRHCRLRQPGRQH